MDNSRVHIFIRKTPFIISCRSTGTTFQVKSALFLDRADGDAFDEVLLQEGIKQDNRAGSE
jgi:hypothetical protein